MNNANLTELIRKLDAETLDALRESIAEELDERREAAGFQLEDIRPGMPAAEWERAANEIARALRNRS